MAGPRECLESPVGWAKAAPIFRLMHRAGAAVPTRFRHCQSAYEVRPVSVGTEERAPCRCGEVLAAFPHPTDCVDLIGTCSRTRTPAHRHTGTAPARPRAA